MKLRKGDVIVFDPRKCHTIGQTTRYSLGVVEGYDRYADCYDVEIGCDHVAATLIPSDISIYNVKKLGRL